MKLLGFNFWLLYLIVEIELARHYIFRLFGFQGLNPERGENELISSLPLRICTLTIA